PRLASPWLPAVGKLLVGLDDEDLAVDYPVPVAHGLRAEGELVAHHRLEVVLQQPVVEQGGLGERPPDLLGRRGHLPFDDSGAGLGGGGHRSILYLLVNPLQQIFELRESVAPEANSSTIGW